MLVVFFWSHHMACGILVPQPGIKPMSPSVEARILNHWTTREVPEYACGRYGSVCVSVSVCVCVCWCIRVHAHHRTQSSRNDREIKAWGCPSGPLYYTHSEPDAKQEAHALLYDEDAPLHFAVNKLEMEQEWTLVSSTCPSSQEVDIWAGPWDYSHDLVEKNERHLPLLFQFWS